MLYAVYLLEVEGLTDSPIYVGRTRLMPEHRLYLHKALFELWERRERKGNKCSSYILFDIAKTMNLKVTISVLEMVDSEQKSKEREGEWFNRLASCRVNKNKPNRSQKQYVKDNWERVKGKMYEYRDKNIDNYKRIQREWRERNKDKIRETNRRNYLKKKMKGDA